MPTCQTCGHAAGQTHTVALVTGRALDLAAHDEFQILTDIELTLCDECADRAGDLLLDFPRRLASEILSEGQMNKRHVVIEITKRRRSLGMTQRQLAGRAGITAVYACMIEKDVCQPSSDVLERLAEAVGLRVECSFEVREG